MIVQSGHCIPRHRLAPVDVFPEGIGPLQVVDHGHEGFAIEMESGRCAIPLGWLEKGGAHCGGGEFRGADHES
jgi:hypothetical protein